MGQAVTIQETSHLPLDSKKIMVKVRLLLLSTHKILVAIPLEALRRINKIELHKLAKAVSEDKMVSEEVTNNGLIAALNTQALILAILYIMEPKENK